jgi:hypothetical protein
MKCTRWVTQFSPEHIKYQAFETPLASALKEFGDRPADNPVSPLRKLSYNSAIPILRGNDFQDETILDGYHTNPSEGLVYVPPKAAPPPCMDDEFIDPRDLPPPNIRAQETVMDTAAGAAVPVGFVSPIGDAAYQYEPPCDNVTGHAVIKNVTMKSYPNMNATFIPDVKTTDYKAPEVIATKAEAFNLYLPTNDGTAQEEDLMNFVVSHYSSLMSKENDVAVKKPYADDPPAPPSPAMIKELTFKPREGGVRNLPKYLEPEPHGFHEIKDYSVAQMEENETPRSSTKLASDCAESFEPSTRVQQNAMANSQFITDNILNPPLTPSVIVTQENVHDQTGRDINNEPQLQPRPDEPVVEGWDVKTVKLEKVQESIGDRIAAVAPPPPVDLGIAREQFDKKQDAIVAEKNKQIEKEAMEQGAVLPTNNANSPEVMVKAHEEMMDDVVAEAEKITGEPVEELTKDTVNEATGAKEDVIVVP